jgi:hypothetical protein
MTEPDWILITFDWKDGSRYTIRFPSAEALANFLTTMLYTDLYQDAALTKSEDAPEQAN